jgi:hypothetical protein
MVPDECVDVPNEVIFVRKLRKSKGNRKSIKILECQELNDSVHNHYGDDVDVDGGG